MRIQYLNDYCAIHNQMISSSVYCHKCVIKTNSGSEDFRMVTNYKNDCLILPLREKKHFSKNFEKVNKLKEFKTENNRFDDT